MVSRWHLMLGAIALTALWLLARSQLPSWVADPQYWWQTPDQKGAALYRAGDFADAHKHFRQSAWRGAACYRAGDWKCAEMAFRVADAEIAAGALAFNRGNTAVRAGQLLAAVKQYDDALHHRPDWLPVLENRALVVAAIDAMEQRKKPDSSHGEPTLPPDGVEVSDKNEKGKPGRIDIEKLSSDAIAQMWLRNVRNDPGDFLRLRFADEARQAGDSMQGRP